MRPMYAKNKHRSLNFSVGIKQNFYSLKTISSVESKIKTHLRTRRVIMFSENLFNRFAEIFSYLGSNKIDFDAWLEA